MIVKHIPRCKSKFPQNVYFFVKPKRVKELRCKTSILVLHRSSSNLSHQKPATSNYFISYPTVFAVYHSAASVSSSARLLEAAVPSSSALSSVSLVLFSSIPATVSNAWNNSFTVILFIRYVFPSVTAA